MEGDSTAFDVVTAMAHANDGNFSAFFLLFIYRSNFSQKKIQQKKIAFPHCMYIPLSMSSRFNCKETMTSYFSEHN